MCCDVFSNAVIVTRNVKSRTAKLYVFVPRCVPRISRPSVELTGRRTTITANWQKLLALETVEQDFSITALVSNVFDTGNH